MANLSVIEHPKNQSRDRLKDRSPSDANRADARQWTIKGLSSATVDVSRDAAKRSGMRLNAWIGQALEAAAESEFQKNGSELERLSEGSASYELIRKQLEAIMEQNEHLENTVNSISTILLKLLAQQK